MAQRDRNINFSLGFNLAGLKQGINKALKKIREFAKMSTKAVEDGRKPLFSKDKGRVFFSRETEGQFKKDLKAQMGAYKQRVRNLRAIRMQRGPLRAVTRTLRAMPRAIGRVIRGFGRMLRGLNSLRRGFRVFTNARFLLGSLAATLGGIQFARLAGEVSNAEISFRSIIRTLGSDPGRALEGFRESLKGTASDLEIFRQVSTAAIFNIAKNANDLQKIFDTARRLGRATGRTTGDAIRDISLGIGRQSRLILDNIGLIVRVQQANEEYAASVGKTVEQLTDLEKQQAFQQAALKAADVAVKRLGEDYLTFNDILLQFSSNIKNAAIAAAKSLTPALTRVLEIFNKLNFESIGEQFSRLAGGILAAITPSIEELKNFVEQNLLDMGESVEEFAIFAGVLLRGIIDRAVEILKDPYEGLKSLGKDILRFIGAVVGDILKYIFNVENLKTIGLFVANLVIGIIKAVADGISGSLFGKDIEINFDTTGAMKTVKEYTGDWINSQAALGKILGVNPPRDEKRREEVATALEENKSKRNENALKEEENATKAAQKTREDFFKSLQKTSEDTDDILKSTTGSVLDVLKAAEEASIAIPTLINDMNRLISVSNFNFEDEEFRKKAEELTRIASKVKVAETRLEEFRGIVNRFKETGDTGLASAEFSDIINKVEGIAGEMIAGKTAEGFFLENIFGSKTENESQLKFLSDILDLMVGEAEAAKDEFKNLSSNLYEEFTPEGVLAAVSELAAMGRIINSEKEMKQEEDINKLKSDRSKFANAERNQTKQILNLKNSIRNIDFQSNTLLSARIAGAREEAAYFARTLQASKESTETYANSAESLVRFTTLFTTANKMIKRAATIEKDRLSTLRQINDLQSITEDEKEFFNLTGETDQFEDLVKRASENLPEVFGKIFLAPLKNLKAMVIQQFALNKGLEISQDIDNKTLETREKNRATLNQAELAGLDGLEKQLQLNKNILDETRARIQTHKEILVLQASGENATAEDKKILEDFNASMLVRISRLSESLKLDAEANEILRIRKQLGEEMLSLDKSFEEVSDRILANGESALEIERSRLRLQYERRRLEILENIQDPGQRDKALTDLLFNRIGGNRNVGAEALAGIKESAQSNIFQIIQDIADVEREINDLGKSQLEKDISRIDAAFKLNVQRAMESDIKGDLLDETLKTLEAEKDANIEAAKKTEDLRQQQGILESLQNVGIALARGIDSALTAEIEDMSRWRAFGSAVGNVLRQNLTTVMEETFRDLIGKSKDLVTSFIKDIGDFTTEETGKIVDAVLGVIGLFLSAQKETNVSEISEDQIQASSSAVRGVIAGPQNVAIAEIGDSIAEANRGTESLLGDILDVLEDIRGNNLTSGGIGAAGTI